MSVAGNGARVVCNSVPRCSRGLQGHGLKWEKRRIRDQHFTAPESEGRWAASGFQRCQLEEEGVARRELWCLLEDMVNLCIL